MGLLKLLLGGSAGVLSLGFFGFIKPIKYHSRFAVYAILVAIAALLGFVQGIVFTLVGKQGLAQHVTARTFYFLASTVLNLRVKIEDPHSYLSTRPAVFICNHQSGLDILLLGATFPKWCSVTAKKALQYYPFLGWFMLATGSVFIDRGNRKAAIKSFEGARQKVVTQRQSVFMFPEGTRSNALEPKLLPFKKGAFHFAQQCQVPIVPYVVANYSNLWSARRRIVAEGIIPVRVCEPVPTVGLETKDVDALVAKVQAEMEKTAKDLGYAIVDK